MVTSLSEGDGQAGTVKPGVLRTQRPVPGVPARWAAFRPGSQRESKQSILSRPALLLTHCVASGKIQGPLSGQSTGNHYSHFRWGCRGKMTSAAD